MLGGLGALAAYPVSGRMLDTLPIGFSLYSRFVAPWIEEAIKAVIMIALFRINRIGYKLDAVISGFAIGAGFSVVENIFYLTLFPDYGTGTWLVRGFGTAIMHGTTLAVLAAIAHEFAERETREAAADYRLQPAVVRARLWRSRSRLHTAFNQFPDRPMLAMMGAVMVAPLALIAILSFGTRRSAALARGRMRRASRAGRSAARRALARRTRRARRSPRSPPASTPRPQARPPLLGAAGVARRRSRGDA